MSLGRASPFGFIFVGALSVSSCASGPTPCVSPDACARNQTCNAGRCAAVGSEIAPADARRLSVAPIDMAVVSSRGGDGALPSEIPLGGASGGSLVVLFRFPTPWGNRVRVASAFLTLEPTPGAAPELGPFPVTVARVLEPWSGSEVTWGRLPRLSAPEARAYATAGPPKTLRIDVTSIVQRWARGRANDQGIALISAPESSVGATYATGVSGARGPRLDVYLR
jgi:hypothetical protein